MELIVGDCREALDKLPTNSVHSVVTDPPYEIGFMQRSWDNAGVSFDPETWRAVYRVLKPGGYLLAFGGTRTFHRIAVAIEDAGFFITPDTLCWLYGQGFPKSHNVSKAFDKRAGVKGEVVGPGQWGDRGRGIDGPTFRHEASTVEGRVDRAPVTDEAKQWAGFGTALKPAWEPIIVAVKPREGTYIENIEIHGVGVMNIDACRLNVAESNPVRTATFYGHNPGLAGHTMGDGWVEEGKNVPMWSGKGRWPANVAIGHHDECVQTGMTSVKSGVWGAKQTIPPGQGGHTMGSGWNGTPSRDAGVSSDGMETVATWQCHPDCPIGLLDQQSGISQKGFVRNRTKGARPFNNDGKPTEYETTEVISEPIGGASRYFFNSLPIEEEDTVRFKYCAKASKRERNIGLDRANDHPTVKPLDLMRWLVRLVTPPNGTVLDPFMGSGTTGMAAKMEGFDFIGIDLSPDYVAMAKQRIAAVPERIHMT
jgi:DNA methylase